MKREAKACTDSRSCMTCLRFGRQSQAQVAAASAKGSNGTCGAGAAAATGWKPKPKLKGAGAVARVAAGAATKPNLALSSAACVHRQSETSRERKRLGRGLAMYSVAVAHTAMMILSPAQAKPQSCCLRDVQRQKEYFFSQIKQCIDGC